MSAAAKRKRILEIVASDKTFTRSPVRGDEVWVGKCLHCNTHLVISLEGEPVSRATIEHIRPRHHGGGDDLDNLGLACARCNREKSHHDRQPESDPKLQALIARLLSRRRARWRDPLG